LLKAVDPPLSRLSADEIVVLRYTEVPLEQNVFSLGVSDDAFPVAPELRGRVGAQEQAGQDPLT